MELLTLEVPCEFIVRTLGTPAWNDVLSSGWRNELVDPAAVAARAAVDAEREDEPSADLIELVCRQPELG